MSANICNICGANLIYKDGKWVCPACGAFKTEEISNEEVTLLYNAAQKLRLASFDDAEEAYRDIIAKYPENSEAHWGLVLSKYGIKYEDDYDGKKLPTCYATSIESVLTDKNYLDAVRLCKDKYQKEYYIEQGKVLEKIRVEWLEKASKEPKYDVFLCFKDSDKLNNVERTDDSIEVADLYTHLSSLGYKVFYSRESLRDKVAEKYEPYIYNALNTAAVMIVYGSKIEYFSSVWMKNEWTRYVRRLREGLKIEGSLVIACDGVNPGDLPRPLNQMQVLDARKKTFYGDLEAHIAKIISIARRPKATVERVEISSAIGKKKKSVESRIKTIKIGGGIARKPAAAVVETVTARELGKYDVPPLTPDENTKLKSANRFIQKDLWQNAQNTVNEILASNKYNGTALLYGLFCEYRVKSTDELLNKTASITDVDRLIEVVEYSDKTIGEKLIAVICAKTVGDFEAKFYAEAIKNYEKIAEYSSDSVKKLREYLFILTAKIAKTEAAAAEQAYDALIAKCLSEEEYLMRLKGAAGAFLAARNFSLAKKYNDKIAEAYPSDVQAMFNAAYVSVKAANVNEFIEKSSEFGVDGYKKLDESLKHLSEDGIAAAFETFKTIFFGMMATSVPLKTRLNAFDFIVKYEFAGRSEFINKVINDALLRDDFKEILPLFDKAVACVDGNDVDKHIALRLNAAELLRKRSEFTLAKNYYSAVLDIEEGNLTALWGSLMCDLKVTPNGDLSRCIVEFNQYNELEAVLKYCPTAENRKTYLNALLSAAVARGIA